VKFRAYLPLNKFLKNSIFPQLLREIGKGTVPWGKGKVGKFLKKLEGNNSVGRLRFDSDPFKQLTRRVDSYTLKRKWNSAPMSERYRRRRLMETWKEKIRRSDAGRARPDLAEELIAETNGAEVLELSPLVGSPSQVSRSPGVLEGIGGRVRAEVLALAPVIKELVRKEAKEKLDE
jgi:hypothetical protein